MTISEQISNCQRSVGDTTPNEGISSTVSVNITTSQKKSVDSSSKKGSSISIKSKFQK